MRRVVCLMMLLAVGLSVPGVVLADARDAFKQAMDHVEAGDWPSAEAKLREAARLDPAEDKRTFVKDYLPHYWLGISLQEQGDCRGAMASFEESKRQGVSVGSNDAGELNARMARCRDTLGQLDEALEEARGAVEEAREADTDLSRMSGSPELAAHWAPFENRRQAALAKLGEAEQLMAQGHSDQELGPIREGADSASQVTSQLLTIAADARSKAGQVSAASNRAQGDLAEAEALASGALRAVQAMEPLPPELAQQAGELRGLLEEIESVESSGNSRRMRDLSRQIAESSRQLKNMALPPPEWLSEAAQRFLDHEFVEALAGLDAKLGRPLDGEEAAPAPNLDPQARFHALLLAAAVRHQLWVTGGREADDEFDQLRADLAEAAELEADALDGSGPSLGRASSRFLSPELRGLWNEALMDAGLELPPQPEGMVP